MTELNEILALEGSTPSLSPSSVSPGLTCCAVSPIDDPWHRGVIVGPGADSAHVSAYELIIGCINSTMVLY